MVDYESARRAVLAAAFAAGKILRDDLHLPGGPRGSGSHAVADGEAEAIIRDLLEAAYPDFGIRGEELSGRDRPARDPEHHVWLIDPNDGTRDYLKGARGSAVSIALLRDGAPVLGVVYRFAAPDDDGDLFSWREGMSGIERNGKLINRTWDSRLRPEHTVLISNAADSAPRTNATHVFPARFRAEVSVAGRLALVAAGEAEATLSTNDPGDWDYAAGHALLIGAGGVLLDVRCKPIVYSTEGFSSSGGACFGGGPTVVADLANRRWPNRYQDSSVEQSPFPLLLPARGLLFGDAAVLRRAQGCILGQIAGDSLGSLVEFQSKSSIAERFPEGPRELTDGGTWKTIAGQPTDDSEMALMLARALAAARIYVPEQVIGAYCDWYETGPYDIGNTTSRALSAANAARRAFLPPVSAAKLAADQKSQTNGSLMRISPLGIFGHAIEEEDLAELASSDSAMTHPNPVCRDAVAVYTVAVARAVREGPAPAALYEYILEFARQRHMNPDVVDALVRAAAAPPDDFLHNAGWVLTAFQNAFYQLLHAPSLEVGVVDTVRQGGDTDTNATIAGALLGAVHGRNAIPFQWFDRVLTCRPLPDSPGVTHPRPRAFWPVDALALAERLLLFGGTYGQQISGAD
jgi:ADP-ribosylglycohydrolase/fructose-1,6-bisphosphatase/inositol monophosphatase family enzyme